MRLTPTQCFAREILGRYTDIYTDLRRRWGTNQRWFCPAGTLHAKIQSASTYVSGQTSVTTDTIGMNVEPTTAA